MTAPFAGVVQRSYALEGNHVLIIDASYEGDAEIGTWIERFREAAHAEAS